MILREEQLKVFDKVNFYDRYLNLGQNYRVENKLEKQEKERVIDLFSKFKYAAQYFSKENFYQAEDILEGIYKFYFRICLKYGVCEIIFGAQNQDTKLNTGGVATRTCKLIKRANQEEITDTIRHPSFSNYEDLECILKEGLSLYKDFQSAVLEFQP